MGNVIEEYERRARNRKTVERLGLPPILAHNEKKGRLAVDIRAGALSDVVELMENREPAAQAALIGALHSEWLRSADNWWWFRTWTSDQWWLAIKLIAAAGCAGEPFKFGDTIQQGPVAIEIRDLEEPSGQTVCRVLAAKMPKVAAFIKAT